MTKFLLAMDKIGKPIWVILGILLLGIVALLDYFTGAELSFSIFYLIPIALFTWAINGNIGLAVACISAAIWLYIEVLSAPPYSSSFVYFWNSIIRLGFFLIPVLLFRNLEKQRDYARTDFLTGVMNARSFHQIAQREIDRSVRYRHPFTVAFIDIDNFKIINDTFGHTFGDKVLWSIAQNMQRNLRKTDSIARLGGDEFALLLPEVDSETARVAIPKIQEKLMQEMQDNQWPVTFSIGVITLNAPPFTVDEILGFADKMMYSVKNYGKNDIKYATY
jgi:diguanylate cyclase (GGDEF)-like protein